MVNEFEEFEQLIQNGELESAKSKIFNWIKDHPSDSKAWVYYGKCFSDSVQQQGCFRRAFILDPNNTEAQLLLNQIENSHPQTQNSRIELPKLENNNFPKSKAQKNSLQIRNFIKQIIGKNNLKIKSSFILYTFFHLILTLVFGAIIFLVFTNLVPGFLTLKKNGENFQRNWISVSQTVEVDEGYDPLLNLTFNPSSIEYRDVFTLEEMQQFQMDLPSDSSTLDSNKLIGIRFTGNLVGGKVISQKENGQPLTLLMNIKFEEVTIHVIYYGSADIYQLDDIVHVKGVYISENNAVVAQLVTPEQNKKKSLLPDDSIILYRITLIVSLWMLLCVSIFFWKINLRKWKNFAVKSSPSIILIFILTISSVLITSCSINFSTTLDQNGMGITTATFRDSKENIDFLRSIPGTSSYFSSLIRGIRESGAEFEQYTEGDQEVFLLQNNMNQFSGGEGNTYPIKGSWISINEIQNNDFKIIRFVCVIDTRTFYENLNPLDSTVESAVRDMLNEIEMVYQLNIPGIVTYHNGQQTLDHQISWPLQMNEVNFLIAESRLPLDNLSSTNIDLSYVWFVLGGIFIFSTLLLISTIWVRPKKKIVSGGS